MVPFGGQKALWLGVLLAVVLCGPAFHIVLADQQTPITTNIQLVQLFVGDSVILTSDQNSIQRVFLQGNLTAAAYTQPTQYPTNRFTLASSSPGTYNVKVLFDSQEDYTVNLFVRVANSSTITNSTTYYLSGGPSELDVAATFNPRLSTSLQSLVFPFSSVNIINGIMSFAHSFPLWVKVLYLALGIQFFTIGGLWIRRETSKRELSSHRFDVGDQVYLWLDIAAKFLLTCFIALVLIMGGGLLVVVVLRYVFLVSLKLVSFQDLFVIGFAFGAMIIVYFLRFIFEGFDMKPLEAE